MRWLWAAGCSQLLKQRCRIGIGSADINQDRTWSRGWDSPTGTICTGMDVSKVPVPPWRCVFTVSTWCSAVFACWGADGQHRAAGTQVSLSLWVLLSGSGEQLVTSLLLLVQGELWGSSDGDWQRLK